MYASGGDAASSTWRSDYVMLFNNGTGPVNLSAWTLQFTAGTGLSPWGAIPLCGAIPHGRFYLVQLASGGPFGASLPAPDCNAGVNLPLSAKIALVNSTAPLPPGACASSATVVDFVGYGAASCAEGSPAPSPGLTTAIARSSPCLDTDNNGADFTVAPALPQNTSSGNGCNNQPPLVAPIPNQTVNELATLTVTPSGSDPNVDPLAWTGAGLVEGMTVNPGTGVLTWTPSGSQAGNYPGVAVQASDGFGGAGSAAFGVAVLDVTPPVALPLVSRTMGEGETLDVQVGATDSDGDLMTVSLQAPSFVILVPGSSGPGSVTATVRITPGFRDAGLYQVVVGFSDGANNLARNFALTVNDAPPTVSAGGGQVVRPGSLVTLDGSASADPGGEPITFQWVQTGGSIVVLSDPASPQPTFTAPSASDHLAFTLTVRDPLGTSAAGMVAITVDSPPSVTFDGPDHVSFSEGTARTVIVRAMDDVGITSLDLDPSGLPAGNNATFVPNADHTQGTFTWTPSYSDSRATPWVARFTATDNLPGGTTRDLLIDVINGAVPPSVWITSPSAGTTFPENSMVRVSVGASDDDAVASLAVDLSTLPSGNNAVFTPDGTNTSGILTWTPTYLDAGSYGITFIATDGAGLSGSVPFVITILNVDRPPVIDPIPPITIAEQASLDQPIQATDPDGDGITISLSGAPTFATYVPDAPQPSPGTATGKLRIQPGPNDAGGAPTKNWCFQIVATDDSPIPASSQRTVCLTVTRTNSPPVLTISPPATITAYEGATLDFVISATDLDTEQTLTFSLAAAPTFCTVQTDSVPSGPSATGRLQIAPGPNDAGTYCFQVRVRDSDASPGIAVAPVCVTVLSPPSAANIPYSGISPGGVDMATGELILVMRPAVFIDGYETITFGCYYTSMLTREGLASGHLGPNWLGTYDWSLSVSGPTVNVVTNRGQLIQFQQNALASYDLVLPADQKYRLDVAGGMWRFTDPLRRRIYLFDGTSRLLTQIVDEHGNSLHMFYGGGLLFQVADGLGRALTFTYDGLGNLTSVSDGTRSVSYSYTGGVLTGVTDAAGHTWTYAYVPPGPVNFPALLTGVTEPLGNTPLTQSYDAMGRVATQTDALGHIATYVYDAPSGNVFTSPLGNSWTYLHDAQNRLSTLTDPAAGVTTKSYDAFGRVATMTRPLGDVTSIAYDATNGYPSRVTLADGSVINWAYGSHLVAGATLFDLATAGYPDGTTESCGRDASGNLTGFTDRGGFAWSSTYNTRGQALTETNPSGGVTTFTYDPQGRPATGTDNAGNTTTYTFDVLSRLTQVTWPDATRQSYSYDARDRMTSFTDERGKLWGDAYDDDDRETSETDPLLSQGTIHWNDNNQVTQVVDPLGHATVNTYDADGRLESVTDRTLRITFYAHDAWGNTTGITDPAGGTYRFSYDADHRLTSGQDPLGHVVLIGHDLLDRVTHITDPVGTGFDYAHDIMGRLRSVAAPLGHTESFNYDPRGLLTSFFDVTSETDFPRTSLGEVSQVTDPNRNGWPRNYDSEGRVTSATDPLGRMTSYEYDSRSRPALVTRANGSTEQLTYDASGRVTGESYSDGTSLTYGYDDANRLTSATGASFSYDAAGRMTSSNGFGMTYDNEGRILSETLAPGKVVSYSYESRGLLSQVMDWMGGTTSFTYDAARRLTGMTRPNGTSVAYQHDAADRLISAVESQPGPTQISSITITRDALGQTTSIARRQPLMPGATSPATTAFAYDPASQINGISHDALGRTTGDASRTFQWDGASRLTQYTAGADSPRYAYDAFGQMLTSTQGSQTVAQAWNYGHGYPTNDDMQVNLPSRTRYLVRTPSGLLLYGVDGTTGARSFYHYDEAGNTIFLTNDGGSVTAEYAYTPYGGVTALGQTADNPFTYGAAAGAIQLGSSGLSRYGSTIYDAVTMRVISENAKNSGHATESAPVGRDPGPINTPRITVHWSFSDKTHPPRVPVDTPVPVYTPSNTGYFKKPHFPEVSGAGGEALGLHYDDPNSDGWYNPDFNSPGYPRAPQLVGGAAAAGNVSVTGASAAPITPVPQSEEMMEKLFGMLQISHRPFVPYEPFQIQLASYAPVSTNPGPQQGPGFNWIVPYIADATLGGRMIPPLPLPVMPNGIRLDTPTIHQDGACGEFLTVEGDL